MLIKVRVCVCRLDAILFAIIPLLLAPADSRRVGRRLPPPPINEKTYETEQLIALYNTRFFVIGGRGDGPPAPGTLD